MKSSPRWICCSRGYDVVLRLARYFGTDAQSWLNLQLSYDSNTAESERKARIEREVEKMVA